MNRNKFSLSHDKLLSCNMGDLIPIGCIEVVPGDQFQHQTNALIRVAPILAPVMHPTHAMVHHFFIPTRLLWDDFENFITGGEDGTSVPVPPYMLSPAGGYDIGSLADYFGLRTGIANLEHSALPLRAYAFLFNENFRDQDLEDPLVFSKASGLDTTTSRLLQRVAWQKDYFTAARPWPQKGPDTYLPMGTSAPVVPDGSNPTIRRLSDGVNNWGTLNHISGGGLTAGAPTGSSGSATIGAATWRTSGLRTDLTAATAVSINDLRTTSALQRYKELMARFGSRYTEYLRTIFQVKSSDARLQRPEYLGGGIQTLQFSEVLQTAEGTDPVGTMRGHGIGALRSNRYRRFFEEHGFVISLISVKPKTMYVQGQPRMWDRKVKEDYFNPILQHIGQQEVLNKELYATGTSTDTQTFAWSDRYAEYRSMESTVSGEFRTTLNYWHMGREFSSLPVLNADFIRANPTTRIYASTDSDQLYIMAHHSIQARRPIAKHANSFLS